MELALEHLYTLATKGTEDPSDEIELAYITIEEALKELERLKRKYEGIEKEIVKDE
jgi:hypothetical protein